MKYPSVILKGEGSHAEVISIAYAGKGQHQTPVPRFTTWLPTQLAKFSLNPYQGRGKRVLQRMVTVSPKAENCKLNVVCDALILTQSQTDTYPTMEVANASARCEHEASVSKVSDDQVFTS